jgi:hypothetical protein
MIEPNFCACMGSLLTSRRSNRPGFIPRTLRQFSVLQACTAVRRHDVRRHSFPCSSFEKSNPTPVTPDGKMPEGLLESVGPVASIVSFCG